MTFKIVFIGDSKIGKSKLIELISLNDDDDSMEFENISRNYEYNPTLLVDEYLVPPWIFVDTPGIDELDRMRPPAYMKGDYYVVCFNFNNASSFHHIKDHWIPEIRIFGRPYVPCLLLGISENDESVNNHNNYALDLSAANHQKLLSFHSHFFKVNLSSKESVVQFKIAFKEYVTTSFHDRYSYLHTHTKDKSRHSTLKPTSSFGSLSSQSSYYPHFNYNSHPDQSCSFLLHQDSSMIEPIKEENEEGYELSIEDQDGSIEIVYHPPSTVGIYKHEGNMDQYKRLSSAEPSCQSVLVANHNNLADALPTNFTQEALSLLPTSCSLSNKSDSIGDANDQNSNLFVVEPNSTLPLSRYEDLFSTRDEEINQSVEIISSNFNQSSNINDTLKSGILDELDESSMTLDILENKNDFSRIEQTQYGSNKKVNNSKSSPLPKLFNNQIPSSSSLSFGTSFRHNEFTNPKLINKPSLNSMTQPFNFINTPTEQATATSVNLAFQDQLRPFSFNEPDLYKISSNESLDVAKDSLSDFGSQNTLLSDCYEESASKPAFSSSSSLFYQNKVNSHLQSSSSSRPITTCHYPPSLSQTQYQRHASHFHERSHEMNRESNSCSSCSIL